MLFSLSMLTPLSMSFLFDEAIYAPFIYAFLLTCGTGIILYFIFRSQQQVFKIRDGFLLVVLFWFVLCFYGSLPFFFAVEELNSLTDALFESISGFTTTGATILQHLSTLPHAILFYRQQLQFLGGMGIVVLAVAILPMLGTGGMQLFRAETTGTMKDTKLTPRIAQTAKALWFIYFVLTLFCLLAYHFAGMNWFDAVGESFATVSTGGFAMHENSFAFYHSELVQGIACLFMLLGGTSFTLHFLVYQKRSLKIYWRDEEFKCYILVLLAVCGMVLISLTLKNYFNGVEHGHAAAVRVLFNVISLATTTGYTVVSMKDWPDFLPFLILLLAIIGGCAASTSGGVKVLRALLLYKQSKREMTRLLHPNAVIPIKIGEQSLPEPILQAMWGFLSVFIALFMLLTLLFMIAGNHFETAFSLSMASLTNTGMGLAQTDFSYNNLSIYSKWLVMFAMIAGRLEIFSVLILLSRTFWRK